MSSGDCIWCSLSRITSSSFGSSFKIKTEEEHRVEARASEEDQDRFEISRKTTKLSYLFQGLRYQCYMASFLMEEVAGYQSNQAVELANHHSCISVLNW